LVFSVRFCVNRIRRAKQNCLNAQAAGKQALGEIEFQFYKEVRKVADVGMGESVIADLVSFAVNALGQRVEALRLPSDQKKSGSGVLPL